MDGGSDDREILPSELGISCIDARAARRISECAANLEASSLLFIHLYRVRSFSSCMEEASSLIPKPPSLEER